MTTAAASPLPSASDLVRQADQLSDANLGRAIQLLWLTGSGSPAPSPVSLAAAMPTDREKAAHVDLRSIQDAVDELSQAGLVLSLGTEVWRRDYRDLPLDLQWSVQPEAHPTTNLRADAWLNETVFECALKMSARDLGTLVRAVELVEQYGRDGAATVTRKQIRGLSARTKQGVSRSASPTRVMSRLVALSQRFPSLLKATIGEDTSAAGRTVKVLRLSLHYPERAAAEREDLCVALLGFAESSLGWDEARLEQACRAEFFQPLAALSEEDLRTMLAILQSEVLPEVRRQQAEEEAAQATGEAPVSPQADDAPVEERKPEAELTTREMLTQCAAFNAHGNGSAAQQLFREWWAGGAACERVADEFFGYFWADSPTQRADIKNSLLACFKWGLDNPKYVRSLFENGDVGVPDYMPDTEIPGFESISRQEHFAI